MSVILLFFGLLLIALVLLLMLLVFGFTMRAFSGLLLVPHSLAALLTNQAVRSNEALKHATMNVIEERFGPSGLNGLTLKSGFTLDGIAPPDIILAAAQEGLRRLRAGERRLAIHKRCVAAIVTAGVLGAVSFLGILLAVDRLTLMYVVLAVVVANAIAPSVGMALQKLLPRYIDISRLQIIGLAGSPLLPPAEPADGTAREHFEIRTAVGR
jgi:hypothetical protein